MHPGIVAGSTPDKAAVAMGDSGPRVTYAELDRRSNQAARLLRRCGLGEGDHLAFQVHDQPELFDLMWGAHRAGIVYTALSTRLGADETAYVVDDCEARVLVVSADLHHGLSDLDAHPMPRIEHRFALASREGTAGEAARSGGTTGEAARIGEVAGWQAWGAAVAAEATDPVSSVAGDDMLYSSGTTGRPKGVMRALAGLGVDQPDPVTLLCQQAFGFDAGTRYLSPAPLYHAAPLRFTRAAQRLGGTVVVMERFDAEEYLRLVERWGITHSQLVPTMFVRLLRLDAGVRARYDVSSLCTVIHAAAPCPVPVKQQMIDWWGPILWEYYAGTEGNGLVLASSEDWLAHPGTVGRPLAGEVHVVGSDSEEVAAGTRGTIYFGGGEPFAYHNDPEKTARSRHPEGWSTLGDVGYVDGDGYLYLTDRLADTIISGGVNVYPQEVENLLILHPAVADVAVFGVPDTEMGEAVKAVVQPARWSDAGPALGADLIAYCRERLAHYKCPRSVDFDPELPRHATGKLYKRVLKDRYWQGHDRRIF